MKRSDLAVEFAAEPQSDDVKLTEEQFGGINATVVSLGKHGGKLLGKPSGKYITLHCEDRDNISCACALAHYITELLKPSGGWEKVLVAGLGNEWVTPDSLGAKTVRRIPATAHLSKTEEFTQLGMRPVAVLEMGVMGQTGIESADYLHYVVKNLLPAAVIVIDSLACSDFSRLGTTLQITDTGIAPGSGVGGSRKELNDRNMGTKVIAVGVPTVIDLESVADIGQPSMMVTPRGINGVINRYSEIISSGINSALNPSLSLEEIELLKGSYDGEIN